MHLIISVFCRWGLVLNVKITQENYMQSPNILSHLCTGDFGSRAKCKNKMAIEGVSRNFFLTGTTAITLNMKGTWHFLGISELLPLNMKVTWNCLGISELLREILESCILINY